MKVVTTASIGVWYFTITQRKTKPFFKCKQNIFEYFSFACVLFKTGTEEIQTGTENKLRQ